VATQNRNVKHIKVTIDKKMSGPQNEVKTWVTPGPPHTMSVTEEGRFCCWHATAGLAPSTKTCQMIRYTFQRPHSVCGSLSSYFRSSHHIPISESWQFLRISYRRYMNMCIHYRSHTKEHCPLVYVTQNIHKGIMA